MGTGMVASHDLATLQGKKVLVVEDEYFLANEMAEAVSKVGGTPLGPVPNVEAAMAIIADQLIDAAILDVRLGDETSFPVAQTLRGQGVHVVFVTGYDDWFMPADLHDVPVYRKPANVDNVVRFLGKPNRKNQD